MKRLGNLDNLVIGMGLTAKQTQLVPAKYSSLEGYGEDSSGNTNLLVFIMLVIVLYVISPKG